MASDGLGVDVAGTDPVEALAGREVFDATARTSLNDVIADITGVRPRETVPDWVIDLADQIELVDMAPHALRGRMMHSNVYPDPRKADLAFRRFFTMENLTALRELALMRVANEVDEELLGRWSKNTNPETRERVLVCVARPGVSEDLVRRGARIAQRAQGDLLVLHVVSGERTRDAGWFEHLDILVQELGGTMELVPADDPVDGVLGYAYRQHVTQIVVGEPQRTRWQELIRGSFVNELIRKATNTEIHLIALRRR